MRPAPAPVTDVPTLLSSQELADRLGVPIKTVYGWAYQGTGPTPIRVGIYTRYDPADVAAWLAERKQTGPQRRNQARIYGPRPVPTTNRKRKAS